MDEGEEALNLCYDYGHDYSSITTPIYRVRRLVYACLHNNCHNFKKQNKLKNNFHYPEEVANKPDFC